MTGAVELDGFRLTTDQIAAWPVGTRVIVDFPFPSEEGGGVFAGVVVTSSEGCLSDAPWDQFCLLMVTLDETPRTRRLVRPEWLTAEASGGAQ